MLRHIIFVFGTFLFCVLFSFLIICFFQQIIDIIPQNINSLKSSIVVGSIWFFVLAIPIYFKIGIDTIRN